MSRKVVRLTLDLLAQVVAPCTECVHWEVDPVRRLGLEPGPQTVEEKEAWVSEVLREWGSCGRIALVDDQPVGFALYAPPAFCPGAAVYPTAPVSPDAVLLTQVYVAPEVCGGGLGRMLVQGVAKDLIKRAAAPAVEAFGDTRGRRSGCLLPADFLGAVGFKTQRAHVVSPRMRMDLRSAISWREEVERAVERVLGAVRPVRAPVPGASRSGTQPR